MGFYGFHAGCVIRVLHEDTYYDGLTSKFMTQPKTWHRFLEVPYIFSFIRAALPVRPRK